MVRNIGAVIAGFLVVGLVVFVLDKWDRRCTHCRLAWTL